MRPTHCALAILTALLASPTVLAQELSPRVGIAAFATLPTGAGSNFYSSGWKVSLTIHVHREQQIEGRVRMELGEFPEGSGKLDTPYTNTVRWARTRLVGYDWLIPLGEKRATGLDLVLGIGGSHWFSESRSTSLPGNPYPYTYNYTDDSIAFAATVGLRYRLSRNIELELHQVFTSTPGHSRDFEDAELSHASIGLGFRF